MINTTITEAEAVKLWLQIGTEQKGLIKAAAYNKAAAFVKGIAGGKLAKSDSVGNMLAERLIQCPSCSSRDFFQADRGKINCHKCGLVYARKEILANIGKFALPKAEQKSKAYKRGVLCREYISGLAKYPELFNSREKRASAEAVSFRKAERWLVKDLKLPFWERQLIRKASIAEVAEINQPTRKIRAGEKENPKPTRERVKFGEELHGWNNTIAASGEIIQEKTA